MNQEFIEQTIESTETDLDFHERSLKEYEVTLAGLEVLEEVNNTPTVQRMLKEAAGQVKWYKGRIVHDHNMLDVLYSARDLTNNPPI